MSAAPAPITEFRTYHGVEVGLIYGMDEGGTPSSWLVFPDGKLRKVRAAAYPSYDEACAAEVAVWRIRRIRLGIDKPTAPVESSPADLYESVRAEADSERVVTECGAAGQWGAKCYRQCGHDAAGTPFGAWHIGEATEGGEGVAFIDDGIEEMVIWRATDGGPRLVH